MPPPESQQPIGGKSANEICIGTKPALVDDNKLTDVYAKESLAIKLGTWNGESASLTDVSQDDFTYVAFTALDRIKTTNKILLIDMTVKSQEAAISSLEAFNKDGSKQQICAGVQYAGRGPNSYITPKGDEKIVKIESKAATPKDGSGLSKIVGLKVETDSGRVYDWAQGSYNRLPDVVGGSGRGFMGRILRRIRLGWPNS